MILKTLNDLYPRLAKDSSYNVAPLGFASQKVSFCIILTPEGALEEIKDLRTQGEYGRRPTFLQIPQPEKRTSRIKAQFLCDKREYLLGIGQHCKLKEFEAFKTKHLLLSSTLKCPEYSALCRFLDHWDPILFFTILERMRNMERLSKELKNSKKLNTRRSMMKNRQALLKEKVTLEWLKEEFPLRKESELHTILQIASQFDRMTATGFGVFQISGKQTFIHEQDLIKQWWIQDQVTSKNSDNTEQCLITGEHSETETIHPDIKGFKSSVALIGIQSNSSYESYEKSKTENCPISKEAAFRYSTALNALLDGPKKYKHRMYLGAITMVFWTESRAIENAIGMIFKNGSMAIKGAVNSEAAHHITSVLNVIKSGKNFHRVEENLETPFHLLSLEQPNLGRFSVRFFHRSTIAELLSNLHAHQKCLEIQKEQPQTKAILFSNTDFPPIWLILKETARVKEEIPPLLGGALARSIFEGIPYPEGLLSALIRRIRIDQTVNYLRAATIKAILMRNHHLTLPISLDESNTLMPYLLGRLFSSLEYHSNQNNFSHYSRVKKHFYSSASSTPSRIFPRLIQMTLDQKASYMKNAQTQHLNALIKQVLAQGFPDQLSLNSQGVFTIGYYHQRQSFILKELSPSHF